MTGKQEDAGCTGVGLLHGGKPEEVREDILRGAVARIGPFCFNQNIGIGFGQSGTGKRQRKIDLLFASGAHDGIQCVVCKIRVCPNALR